MVLGLYASQIDDIIKNIPKNSPNYSLAIILKTKIENLKYTRPVIKYNITDEKSYLNAFENLINLQITRYNLINEIIELNKKISILSNQTNPIAQLQYQYYKNLAYIKNKKLNFISENFKSIEKEIYSKITLLNFDIKSANKKILSLKNTLQQLNKQYETLKINLQKFILLNENQKINEINLQIQNIVQKRNTVYKKLIREYIILWSEELKYKNKHAFKTDDYILNYAKQINKYYYKAVNQIVNDFEHFTFGAKVLVYSTKKEVSFIWDKLLNFINYPLFKVEKRTITPLNFAIFILVVIIGWFIGKYYKYFIYKLRHRYKLSHSTATLLANMGYYAIVTLSFLIALKVVGLDLSSLAIIAGALSVGIGFGLQNVVSNFVSGIILMFERSIKVGDYIQIDQDTRGEVVDISMRSTVIRTNDNINLIIPNQSFIQNNVINWTLGDDIVRFRVPFGVAYGSDIDKVEKVILEKLKNTDLPIVRNHPTLDVTPYVVFMEMADSSLNFELFIWVKGEYARRPRRTRSRFLKMIYNALNEAGINIPFPQQDLHIKDSVPFEITIKK
jgi:small-conductance mechanosensitive channel